MRHLFLVLTIVLSIAASAAFRKSLQRSFHHSLEESLAQDGFTRDSPPLLGDGQFQLAIGLAIAAGGGAFCSAWMQRRKKQKIRNEQAQRLAEESEREISQILKGSSRPSFFLYLRPFKLTGQLSRRKGLSLPGSPRFFLDHWKIQFDEFLQTCFDKSDAQLICLGYDDHQFGAGRIETEDADWRERFRMLAQLAQGIILIPGAQPGIVEELGWLRISGHLAKTVLFKPLGYSQNQWEHTARVLEEQEGVDLPSWDRHQLSFRLYSSGRHHDLIFWKRTYFSARRGRQQMDSVMRGQPLS